MKFHENLYFKGDKNVNDECQQYEKNYKVHYCNEKYSRIFLECCKISFNKIFFYYKIGTRSKTRVLAAKYVQRLTRSVRCISRISCHCVVRQRRMPILLSGEGAAQSSGNSRIVTRTIVEADKRTSGNYGS